MMQFLPPIRDAYKESLPLRLQRALAVGLLICGLLAGCGESPKPAAPVKPPKKASSKSKTQRVSEKSEPEPERDPAPDAGGSTNPQVAEASSEAPAAVQKIHRPDDNRPPRNDAELQRRGFLKLTTPRFILYTDVPKDEVADLPEAIAQLYNVMESYFGRLPPDRAETPYQMTGYLMADPEKFRAAGILAEGPAQPHEGWYLGNEFWWNRQATPYYTRHLMLHEATHCFMHVMPAVDCPPWYVEGMAELFGTFYRDEKGEYRFGVLPDSSARLAGWARVSVLQEELAAGNLRDVDQILAFTFDEYAKLPPYAWSWALCHFLNNHPRYKVPFRKLAKGLYDGGFIANATELFRPFIADLRDEWLLFASQIQYGHDIERSIIAFQAGKALAAGSGSGDIAISSTRGWQSSRIKLDAGRKYRVRSSGRFTVATTTKPWISEPQGISIRYFAGQPLGRLLGTIRPEPAGDSSNRDILKLIPLGPDITITAPHSGTLYLRLNDAWNELADNSGDVHVEIEAAD